MLSFWSSLPERQGGVLPHSRVPPGSGGMCAHGNCELNANNTYYESIQSTQIPEWQDRLGAVVVDRSARSLVGRLLSAARLHLKGVTVVFAESRVGTTNLFP